MSQKVGTVSCRAFCTDTTAAVVFNDIVRRSMNPANDEQQCVSSLGSRNATKMNEKQPSFVSRKPGHLRNLFTLVIHDIGHNAPRRARLCSLPANEQQ